MDLETGRPNLRADPIPKKYHKQIRIIIESSTRHREFGHRPPAINAVGFRLKGNQRVIPRQRAYSRP